MLAFAAPPDDTELACCGVLMAEIAAGKKVGVADLTRGELGTRGTAALRDIEAAEAARIVGLHVRENLQLADGYFENTADNRHALIQVLRRYRPDIVLANALNDRHPDHRRGAQIVADACFFAGLPKIPTFDADGTPQAPWRPRLVLHYIQDYWIKPEVVVDISPFMERKMQAIRAFKSQFYDPASGEPETYISSPQFLENIIARAREHGRPCNFEYAEAFNVTKIMGVKSVFDVY